MDAFRLGPIVLSAPRFYALVALATMVLLAELMARGRRRATPQPVAASATTTDASTTTAVSSATPEMAGVTEPTVEDLQRSNSGNWAWNTALAIVLAARIGFVLENFSVYLQAPLSALAFWQGGFSPWWGVGAGALVVLWSARAGLGAARGVIVPAAVALVVWFGLPALLSPADTIAANLPDVVITRLEGGQLALADLRGEPVVVNLWATWCPPCRRELPLLASAANANPDVHFVFANQREAQGTVSEYLAGRPDLELRNVVLDRTGQLGEVFRSIGLPTTLFFDAEGHHVATHVGEVSPAALVNYLADLRR